VRSAESSFIFECDLCHTREFMTINCLPEYWLEYSVTWSEHRKEAVFQVCGGCRHDGPNKLRMTFFGIIERLRRKRC
jgi:hypothetical protein